MARGIPRPSILEVLDFFSLLNSPRNRFYNSSAPRLLAKIPRGPRKHWISFLSTFLYKENENIRKFLAICQKFSVFITVFQNNQSIFGIITEHSKFWNINSMLKFFIHFFFIFFFNFVGDFQYFWHNSFLQIPRGPRGIDFIFLDPRGM
jgi:hypothetical protein